MDSIRLLDRLLFEKIAKPAERQNNLSARRPGIWCFNLVGKHYYRASNYARERYLLVIALDRGFFLFFISHMFVGRIFLGQRNGGDFPGGA